LDLTTKHIGVLDIGHVLQPWVIRIRLLAQRVQLIPSVVYIVSHKYSNADPERITTVTKIARVLELGARQDLRVNQKQAEALDGRGKVFVNFLKGKELAFREKTRSGSTDTYMDGQLQRYMLNYFCPEARWTRSIRDIEEWDELLFYPLLLGRMRLVIGFRVRVHAGYCRHC
jgi:hypothetical protein